MAREYRGGANAIVVAIDDKLGDAVIGFGVAAKSVDAFSVLAGAAIQFGGRASAAGSQEEDR